MKILIIAIVLFTYTLANAGGVTTPIWQKPVPGKVTSKPNGTQLFTEYDCPYGTPVVAPMRVDNFVGHDLTIWTMMVANIDMRLAMFGITLNAYGTVEQGQVLGYCNGPTLKVTVAYITPNNPPLFKSPVPEITYISFEK